MNNKKIILGAVIAIPLLAYGVFWSILYFGMETPKDNDLIAGDAKAGLLKPPETEVACFKDGGIWALFPGPYSEPYLEGYYCNLPTSDAGKSCADGSQCQGECVGKYQGTDLTSGKCSDRRVALGCFSYFRNGIPKSICSPD